MTVRAIAVLSFAAAVGACQPTAPQFTAADETAVRALFDSVVSTVRAANWDAWGNTFAEDARFHAPNSPPLLGRAAIINWGKSFPPIETFTFGPPEIHGEGTVAYGWSAVYIKLRDLPADTSKQLVVARKGSNGQWSVAAVAINTDLPLPKVPQPPRG